jgi:hypothetical protein
LQEVKKEEIWKGKTPAQRQAWEQATVQQRVAMVFEKPRLACPHLIIVPPGLEDNWICDWQKLTTRFKFTIYTASTLSQRQLSRYQTLFTDHCPERRWEIVITTPNCLRNRHGPAKYSSTLSRQGLNKRDR